MIRKRRHTRRNYQVLRENESPQGVNCIFYRSAERLTRLCGAGAPFRPLFLTPFRRSLFRGTEDFPNHHGGPKTLRQPRKYRRINGSCQLDSIQKINPRSWPIPCSSRRPLQQSTACGVPLTPSRFVQLPPRHSSRFRQTGAFRNGKRASHLALNPSTQ